MKTETVIAGVAIGVVGLLALSRLTKTKLGISLASLQLEFVEVAIDHGQLYAYPTVKNDTPVDTDVLAFVGFTPAGSSVDPLMFFHANGTILAEWTTQLRAGVFVSAINVFVAVVNHDSVVYLADGLAAIPASATIMYDSASYCNALLILLYTFIVYGLRFIP